MFLLSDEEFENLRSHFVTSSQWDGRRYPTYAFEDMLRFKGGISEDQLWLWRDEQNLNIGVINSEDKIVIENWYQQHQKSIWPQWKVDIDPGIERIQLDNGSHLLENQVEQLVQAMAVFNVRRAGSLDIPHAIQEEVNPVIAVTWHS